MTLSLFVGLFSNHFVQAGGGGTGKERTSRISDDSIPELDVENFPKRPKPLLELGGDFLGTGTIQEGVVLPWGTVWQPSLLVFGTYRSAWQFTDRRRTSTSEWVNRLDIFANLQLTGTERVLLGLRPLDQKGRFTGHRFLPNRDLHFRDTRGTVNAFDDRVETLFFEGDFGELFPGLDWEDNRTLDWGFSVGRQPLFYQDGMLVNDTVDSIGITRNTLLPRGGTDFQMTWIYGWDEINRGNNVEVGDQRLYGFSMAADYPRSTFYFDTFYVHDEGTHEDGVFLGFTASQRIGHYSTTFRILASEELKNEGRDVQTDIASGYLFYSSINWTPAWTDDIVYWNFYGEINDFTSAARGDGAGSPLGPAGLLFRGVGMGSGYRAPIPGGGEDTVGSAIGYQWFITPFGKKQLIVELGGRQSTVNRGEDAAAVGARYRQALSQRTFYQIDLVGSHLEELNEFIQARAEIRVEF